MTTPHEAGTGPGTWLDMSRYPDTDPDTALTGEEQDLLSASLAVDDAALPDAVWEHMLAVVTGADDTADDTDTATDTATETDPADPASDDWAGTGWDTDPALHDPADADPADVGDDPAWDGGAV